MSALQADTEYLKQLIEQEGLPQSYEYYISQYFLPLSHWLAKRQQAQQPTLLVGINGAQGTGKSTLTLFLSRILESQGLRCASFSLDDIYHTQATRRQLAEQIHPLLQTRGVPGTHDLALGQATLDALMGADERSVTAIPKFDKAQDDRAPQDQWRLFQARPQIILLEGWCLAARPQAQENLVSPINPLEREQDQDAVWRQFVNRQLETDYQKFFQQLDCLVMLKAPSMDAVLTWRTLQERKLAERFALHQNGAMVSMGAHQLMNDAQIRWFIMHYERLTRHMLEEMPARADVLLAIDEAHQITQMELRDD